MVKKLVFIVLVLLMFSAFPGSQRGQAATTPHSHPNGAAMARPWAQGPTFEAAPCMFEFDVPFISVEQAGIDCGYLTVPERHSDPTGPTIRLAVAILNSTSANPAPDPLVMAQGGPGGSTIEFAQFLVNSPLLAYRDIILFDQRGTLYSEPSLFCPEVIDYTVESIERELTLEEDLELSTAALLACRSRLVAEGVNLAAYNSLENAADINALRLALGYDRINLYGISYGTLLALHTMREHPEALRSVILDAVVPTQTNFLTGVSETMDRAFSQLFEACAADVTCQTDYPNLEQRFFDLVDRLNESPIRITLTDPETRQSYDATLTGDDLLDVMFQYLYQTDFIPVLPKLIDDISRGDYAFLANTLPLFLFDRTFSMGMYHSVLCAEDADFGLSDVTMTGVRPQFSESAQAQTEAFLDVCAQWNVPPLGPLLDEPVRSDIPTLLFSGRFDPITPPTYAAEAARTLPRSYSYTFPVNGHGTALPGTPCTNQIITAFLTNPTVEPNAACVEALPDQPPFLPASTLSVGLVGALATSPNSSHLWQFSLLGLALLGLLSAWLVWPLLIFIHWLRKKAFPRWSGGSWAITALTLLVGLLGLIFIAAFIGAIIFAFASGETLSLLLVGLPVETAPIFVLPPLFLLLTGVLVAGAVLVWLRGYWSLVGRIYYSLLVIFALLYSVILVQWDMLTVLL